MSHLSHFRLRKNTLYCVIIIFFVSSCINVVMRCYDVALDGMMEPDEDASLFDFDSPIYTVFEGGNEEGLKPTKNRNADAAIDGDYDCFVAQDIILNDEAVLTSLDKQRKIPYIIHLILPDKSCIKPIIYERINKWHMVQNHSIMFHDEESIYELMNKERPGISHFLKPAQYCALSSHAKHDLAKIMLLWDYGGFVVSDMNLEPSSLLIYNMSEIVYAEHEMILEFDSNFNFTKRIMASVPRHPFIYFLLLRTIDQFQTFYYSYYNEEFTPYEDTYKWDKMIMNMLFENFHFRKPREYQTSVTFQARYTPSWFETPNGTASTVTLINKDNLGTSIAINVRQGITKDGDDDDNQNYLQPASDPHRCVHLNDDEVSYTVNLTSLRELVGADVDDNDKNNSNEEKTQCPEGLYHLKNHFPQNFTVEKGRKIPKIIHFTAKSRCVTKFVYDGLQAWYFPGYAVVVHDDDAVDRLFEKHWPMLPLINDVRSCAPTGAGKADLWRYLVTWEYGGIYTDIDNIPGKLFNETLLLKDDTDALFEVETQGFPSQYFFAVSPHHPVMYFSIQHAISRLLAQGNVRYQHVIKTTGPAALKCSFITLLGGSGFVPEGNYNIEDNRNITMIGQKGRQRDYVGREKLNHKRDRNYHLMNMTRYDDAKWRHDPNGTKIYSCVGVLYEEFLQKMERL